MVKQKLVYHLSWKSAVQDKYVFLHEDFGLLLVVRQKEVELHEEVVLLVVVVFQNRVDFLHEEFVQGIGKFQNAGYFLHEEGFVCMMQAVVVFDKEVYSVLATDRILENSYGQI